MTTFPKYKRYKPSGIEWIGEIPEEWEVKKLKYLINIQAGYAFKTLCLFSERYGYSSFTRNQRQPRPDQLE